MSNNWTDHERKVLTAVADMLIPAGDGMPSASSVGVLTEGIDEIASLRPDLRTTSQEAVGLLGAGVPGSVADLRAALPDHFAAVSELLASAYFLRPEVAALLGYRARKAIPLDDEMLRLRELEHLTKPVVSRGNTWRRTEGP
ncbi:MAG: hypothetical protein QM655_08700 [Nocardioidaceae bacterium]